MSDKPKTKRRGRGEGSITKRKDGRWQATVDLGFNASGKRQRKVVYAPTRQEVHDKLQDELDKKRKGLINPTKATVGEWISQYLDDAKTRLRPRTLRNYELTAKNQIYPTIGKMKLSKLHAVHVDRLYRQLESEGKQGTACVVAKIIKPAFKKAKRLGMISVNPTYDVDPPREAEVHSKTWTPDEAETFLQAIKENRDYALYVTAIYCGLRIGELCALRWENVRLDDRQLDVKHTIGPDVANLLGPPKTKSSERTVTLPQSVVDALHERRKQNLTEGNAGSPWVFCAPRGGNSWDSDIRNRAKALMKKSGVPVIKFHEIRHFMPTSLLSSDANPGIVSKQLGHSSVKMTLDRYSHVNTEHQRQVSDAMENIMTGVREQRKSS